MRILPVIFGLLLGLALQPALAGGWGRQQEPPRREPPRQQYPQQYPQQYNRMPPEPRPQLRIDQRPPQNWPAPPHPMSGNEAAQRAQSLNGGGRVLAVDPAQSGYRVRVLKDGEVRSVYVPQQ